jgi:hypothetical protein
MDTDTLWSSLWRLAPACLLRLQILLDLCQVTLARPLSLGVERLLGIRDVRAEAALV